MSVLDHFAWPAAAVALLALPLLALATRWLDAAAARRQRRVLGARAAALTVEVGAGPRLRRRMLWGGGLALGVLALMQPRWGEGERVVQRGTDIVVCLDLSRSMLARDLAPSRLECAQREVAALAEHTRGDRLALVVFAGEARLYVPLTQDVESVATLVAQVHSIPPLRAGTDLGQAIDAAGRALTPGGGTVVLLTDGEDHGGEGLRAARACAARGVTVHCVGFGSARGSKIAVGEAGHETWLRDRAGNDVVSALDPDGLRDLAAAGGGEFALATPRAGTLAALYERRIRAETRRALAQARLDARENRFQWPLALAVVCWLLELSGTARRRTAR